MRFVFSGNDFYVGSRSQWLKPDQPHIWNRSVTPEMRVWARANRDTVLYGECYGSKVQSLTYGLENRAVRFAAFAALKEGAWVDQLELFRTLAHIGVEHAPVLHQGSYDLDGIKALAETDSHVSGAPSGHMKEGVVIVPLKERRDTNIGRVALKHISNRYWESNHG
jgi:hypothetical protein